MNDAQNEHHAYVIARLSPDHRPEPHYRCIAAIRHAKCDGILPLQAAQRFMTLARQPENAEIIRWEVRTIKFGKRMYLMSPSALLPVPCPYLAFLLAISWHVDLSKDPGHVYISGGRGHYVDDVCDVEKGLAGDRITVFDITDPKHPTYGFVSRVAGAAPQNVPLTATQYFSALGWDALSQRLPGESSCKYETDDTAQSILTWFSFQNLVDQAMLQEVWPSHFVGGHHRRGLSTNTAIKADHVAFVPTLVELSLRVAVARAIDTHSVQDLREILFLPGMLLRVKRIVRNKRPFCFDAWLLLLKAIAISDGMLDLPTGEYHFDWKQTLQVISAWQNLEWLTLSGGTWAMTLEKLKAILEAAPHLRRLVLLKYKFDPNVLRQIAETEPTLLDSLHGFVHPSFLQRSHVCQRPNSFTFLRAHAHCNPEKHEYKGCSLSVSTPLQIVQCLTDYLAPLAQDTRRLETPVDSSYACYAAFTGGVRREGQSWATRSVVTLPHLHGGAFRGEGWLFILLNENDISSGPTKYKWGFVRWVAPFTQDKQKASGEIVLDISNEGAASKSKSKVPWTENGTSYSYSSWGGQDCSKYSELIPEIHDLPSFLNILYDAGRSRASEDAVRELETILLILQEKAGAAMVEADDLRPYHYMLAFVL